MSTLTCCCQKKIPLFLPGGNGLSIPNASNQLISRMGVLLNQSLGTCGLNDVGDRLIIIKTTLRKVGRGGEKKKTTHAGCEFFSPFHCNITCDKTRWINSCLAAITQSQCLVVHVYDLQRCQYSVASFRTLKRTM